MITQTSTSVPKLPPATLPSCTPSDPQFYYYRFSMYTLSSHQLLFLRVHNQILSAHQLLFLHVHPQLLFLRVHNQILSAHQLLFLHVHPQLLPATLPPCTSSAPISYSSSMYILSSHQLLFLHVYCHPLRKSGCRQVPSSMIHWSRLSIGLCQWIRARSL